MTLPSGSQAVGRSGTSFSGVRDECAWGHAVPQNSATATLRHHDGVILLSLFRGPSPSFTLNCPLSHCLSVVAPDTERAGRKGQEHPSNHTSNILYTHSQTNATHTRTRTHSHIHKHSLSLTLMHARAHAQSNHSLISTIPFRDTKDI